MARLKRRFLPPGSPPGTLALEDEKGEKATLRMIVYSVDHVDQKEDVTIDEFTAEMGTEKIAWLDIKGSKDPEMLQRLNEKMGFHPLALEDVINGGQRAKVEDYDDHLFITAMYPVAGSFPGEIRMEQVNIFMGRGFVVTVHDSNDFAGVIRERIKDGKGRIRKMGADYLVYALLDLIVDLNFPMLEKIGDYVEVMDERIIDAPTPDVVKSIRETKRSLIYIRNSIMPMREVVSEMARGDFNLIDESISVFLRDVYDHTVRLVELVESYRDILSEMFSVYLSAAANTTNEVMKVLTIFATIFIPLTFIVGIYGMNFDYMPELHYKFAYPTVWVIMIAMGLGMIAFFKRRKWL